MCFLASSAVHSSPVERSPVAAPQPCFEASEVRVMSTSPRFIELDAVSIELFPSLVEDGHYSIKIPFVVVLKAVVLSRSK